MGYCPECRDRDETITRLERRIGELVARAEMTHYELKRLRKHLDVVALGNDGCRSSDENGEPR